MTFFRPLSSPKCQRAVYLLLSLAMMFTAARAAGKEDYRNLLYYLELQDGGNYSKDIRPTNNSDESTEVYLALILNSILEVNEKEQTLKTNTELEIEWEDDYLSWEPADFAYIESILMRQERLWLPDIVLSNTVSTQKQLGYKYLKLRIKSNGAVVWKPSGIFDTTCEFDITYYPFDTQVCQMVFMTAMSLKSEITVYIDKENPIQMDEFSPNGLWVLVSQSAQNSGDEDSRTKITFTLQLQRRRSYYILNIVLPVLFLSVTSSLTFALPSDSGEKMGLSITVLLAYAVYLTLVNDAMPHTSVQVSVITIYLVLLLAVSVASVLLSVLILRFHHRPPSSPVTGRLVTVVVALRVLTCMDKLQSDSRLKEDEQSDYEEAAQEKESTRNTKVGPRANNWVGPVVVAPEEKSGGCCDKAFAVKSFSGKEVAETLDKFIFLAFTIFVLATTVACVLALLIGAQKQEHDAAAVIASGRLPEAEKE